MTRTTMFGVSFALLMSGAAVAQTNPLSPGEAPPPPAVDQIAPSAEAPLMPLGPQPGADTGTGNPLDHDTMMGGESTMDSGDMRDGEDAMAGRMRGDDDRRGRRARDRGPRGKMDDRHGQRHWRHHGGGRDMGSDGNEGAVLSFSQGEGGPSFRIRCAAQDTTLECASAIMPMLARLMPQQPAAGQ